MTAHLSALWIHRSPTDGPSEKATLQSTFLEKTGNLHISFRPKEREREESFNKKQRLEKEEKRIFNHYNSVSGAPIPSSILLSFVWRPQSRQNSRLSFLFRDIWWKPVCRRPRLTRTTRTSATWQSVSWSAPHSGRMSFWFHSPVITCKPRGGKRKGFSEVEKTLQIIIASSVSCYLCSANSCFRPVHLLISTSLYPDCWTFYLPCPSVHRQMDVEWQSKIRPRGKWRNQRSQSEPPMLFCAMIWRSRQRREVGHHLWA